jgi:hypothetical protein
MSIKKIAIAVTFHYVESRLKYLAMISTQFHTLADEVLVYVFTNVSDDQKLSQILLAVKQNRYLSVEIHTPTYIGHPKLLTWSHFFIFKSVFNNDPSITHFMYLEDDILITKQNIDYWLKARKLLEGQKLVPSFLRYEKKEDSLHLFSTDCTQNYSFCKLPNIKISEEYCFLNVPEPYQGMYLLDRELMREHINGPSSVPEYTPWGISEKAAAGLTFINVPYGCYSRNFFGYDLKQKRIDPDCLIHHLPNNYLENLQSPHGKVSISELITFGFLSLFISQVLNHKMFPKFFLRLLGRGKPKM